MLLHNIFHYNMITCQTIHRPIIPIHGKKLFVSHKDKTVGPIICFSNNSSPTFLCPNHRLSQYQNQCLSLSNQMTCHQSTRVASSIENKKCEYKILFFYSPYLLLYNPTNFIFLFTCVTVFITYIWCEYKF